MLTRSPGRPEPEFGALPGNTAVSSPCLSSASKGLASTYQGWRLRVKRLLDLLLATSLFILLMPLMLAIALAILLAEGRPIFFRQRRLGLGGETFTLTKFRTMVPDAEEYLNRDQSLRKDYEESGFKLPVQSDPRITAIGRFLRRTSLDELPQLAAVIRGTMSLIGPRPVLEAELEVLYGRDTWIYLSLKPGLTGLWQCSGRSEVVFADRKRLDFEYFSSWSLGLDIRILGRTVPRLFSGAGAW